jgi:hypothetical protein
MINVLPFQIVPIRVHRKDPPLKPEELKERLVDKEKR